MKNAILSPHYRKIRKGGSIPEFRGDTWPIPCSKECYQHVLSALKDIRDPGSERENHSDNIDAFPYDSVDEVDNADDLPIEDDPTDVQPAPGDDNEDSEEQEGNDVPGENYIQKSIRIFLIGQFALQMK